MAQLTPRIRHTAQNTQYTYSLDRRIHDVKTYPVQSPQGATILICGHENGVTLSWRGGRRLKPSRFATASKAGTNGPSTEDAVMIIDSDDESPSAPSASAGFADKPEFEDESGADHSSIPEIVQTLDLALGTAVLRIAVLPMGPSTPEAAAWSGAEILRERMVFAVACTTGDVYVMTLPLTPPSYESKARSELCKDLMSGSAGRGAWAETLTLLTGQRRHNEGLAIALVKRKSGSERSRSTERSTTSNSAPHATRVVVAGHSREANGTLRLWDVPVESRLGVISRVDPFQIEYLPSPLSSISFNPRNSTQLLTVSSSQAVRIYDYSLPALPSEDPSEGPFPTHGSWLLSLYAPFYRGPQASRARKPVVAASWISNGRAILALLADGQWGIWDMDGARPSAKSTGPAPGLFGKHAAGLRGSAITAFSVTGHLEGTSPLRTSASQKAPSAPGTGEFVPMTPHTRRDALASSLTSGPERLAAVRGGIAVTQLSPTTGAAGVSVPDEAAVLWIGAGADPVVAIIPGISCFWEAQLRRGVGGGVNLFSGAQPTRMLRLTDLCVGLLGERCTGASCMAPFGGRANNTGRRVDSTLPDRLPVEVILQGETRLVIVREGGSTSGSGDDSSVANKLLATRDKHPAARGYRAVSTNAIIAYPRPEKPGSVAFNLSVPRHSAGGSLRPQRHLRAPVAGLFGDAFVGAETSDDTVVRAKKSGPRFRDSGFLFANDLGQAADQPDDEGEAEGRDVEKEMMDIMEIDRELEMMESERGRGTRHVFFEEE